jgi:tetratricopeptide (TPR) repeat protein
MDDDRRLATLLIAFVFASAGVLVGTSAAADPRTKPARPQPQVGMPTAPAKAGSDTDPAPGTMPEVARLERITAKRPADNAAHLAAARHYLEQSYGADSRLVDASRHANTVLRNDPRNFEALMLSGDIESQRHRPDLAVQHYRNAAVANPDSKEAVLALSGALDRAGDHASAQEAFAKYRQLNGMSPVPGSPAAPGSGAKSN